VKAVIAARKRLERKAKEEQIVFEGVTVWSVERET